MSLRYNDTYDGADRQESTQNTRGLPLEEDKKEINSPARPSQTFPVIFDLYADYGTPEEQFAKWLNLTQILHAGGQAAYIWQCSEIRKPRTLKSGKISYTDAAFKQTIWYPTNVLAQMPAEKVNGVWVNNYFGVHPTNRTGTTYQRATNAKGGKSPHVYASNCLFAEFDAKDFDDELATIALKYKEHLKKGNLPHTFDPSGAKAARERGMQAAWSHILRMPIPPSIIVMSGGGFQTYTLLNETIIFDNASARQSASTLQASWVNVVGGDEGAKDLARVLRIPGTHNRKRYYEDGPHLVHFIPANETRVDISTIEKAIKTAQRRIFALSPPSNNPSQSNQSQSNQSQASQHQPVKSKPSAKKIDTTKKALSKLSKERCHNYQDWIKVGIVLHHELGDAGLPLWIEWSKQSHKYEEGACETKWITFATNGTKIGLGTLIRWAKEDNAEPLSVFEDIKFQIEALITNGASSEEVTIKIDEWTEKATELSPVELSSICKILRFRCEVKAQDVTQWRSDINATKKASRKGKSAAEELISKIPGYHYDVDLVEFERNDAGNADAVCAKWNHAFRHVLQWGWLYWTGTHWETQGAEKVLFATVKVVLRERITQALNANLDASALKSFYNACTPSTNQINHTITQLKMDPEWDRVPEEWDVYNHLLNVANGVIDLRTGELIAHNSDLMFTSCIKTAFNPDADVTLITSYLLDLGLSVDLINYLQIAVGYTLTGETNEECLFYLLGPTRSGKGTFCSALVSLLERPLAAEIDFNTLTSSKIHNADAQNFALAPLKPCRLVVASESSKYHALNEEKVKRITGGDQIHCAFKGKTHFNYKPKFKIWLASNHKPIADVDDDAIWKSRIKIVVFPKSFLGTEDKGLKKRMTEDPAYLEALLLWAVLGAIKWYESPRGLVVPREVKEATAEARRDLDYVEQWIDENLIVLDETDIHITTTTTTAKGWTANNNLYANYESWCHENGVSPKKARAFGQALTKKGYERRRLRTPNSNKRVYVRFGLMIDKNIF